MKLTKERDWKAATMKAMQATINKAQDKNAALLKVIKKYGTIRHKADCDTFNCDCGLDKLKLKAGIDQRKDAKT